MTLLWEKLRVGIAAKMHALVDVSIDWNNPNVLKQHARELEEGIRGLRGQKADMTGQIEILHRRKTRLNDSMLELGTGIDLVLTDEDPSNDHLAESMGKELLGLQEEAEALEVELTDTQLAADAITKIYEQTTERHSKAVIGLRKIEREFRMAQSSNRIADSLEQASRLAGSSADGPSVDSIADRISVNAASARARLQQHLDDGAPSTAASVIGNAKLAALLAARKAKLGIGAPAATPAANS